VSFPNHPDKHGAPSLLQAADIVAYRDRLGRALDFTPEGVLFCLERGLPHRMRRRIPVRLSGHMNADVYQVKRTRVAVLTSFGGGSPMVAELAEELIAMGARKIFLMTWGGILQPDMKPGDIVVCDRAVRDEGTSHHYLPPAKHVTSDPLLVDELVRSIQRRGAACTVGTTWTTDAPYRETRQEILAYQSEGVKVVELESAGLFTIGQVRGIPVASAVVGMDSLASLEWKVPDRLDGIMGSLETVYAAAIEVLAAR
jgi:uridine phosphorylase